MKETVRITEQFASADRIELLRASAVHIAAGGCGWLASRAVLNGGILPFGLAFLCGMPRLYMPATALGVFFGYLFPAAGSSGFRYIAALFCILSVKLLLCNRQRLVENPFVLSSFSLGVEFITIFVSLADMNTDFSALLCEALLTAGGTFFVAKATAALSVRPVGLSGEGLAALLITVTMLLSGLQRISLLGISLGRIGSILLVLICARYGGILSGAVSGIAVAVAGMLTFPATPLYISLAFAGLLAGVLMPYGKYAQVGGLLVAMLGSVLSTGFSGKSAFGFIEVLIGSAVFLLLPRSAGILCGKLFCALPQILTQSGLRKAVSMRLALSADALSDISQTVDRVAEELGRLNTPDYSRMIACIEQEACKGCPLRKQCWDTGRTETLEAVLSLTKAVRSGERNLAGALSNAFREKCHRSENLIGAVSRNYTAYTAKIAAENRVDEVRSVLSEEFKSIAELLDDLRVDIEREERFDHAMALNVSTTLRSLNIRADECSCIIDKYGRMTVRIKLKRDRETVLNKRQIMKAVSLVSERDFGIPTVTEIGGNVFINLAERTVYNVQIGIAQYNAKDAALSGDTCRQFCDGTGHYYLLLSDGMGTGGRAAIDSSMTSGLMARLLRAGFGFDCALRVLNSAMLFKSSDESLATVDLAAIDLYTGETKLFKAGAAATVIRKGNKTGVAESRSLPIGILQDISFDRMSTRLQTGDIVVMISDGVTVDGTEWIEKAVCAWGDGTAEDLAEHISAEAKRRQPAGHEDDITVLTAILNRNI
ncbi:MAG: SpoIIE family protein phosphatase [Clostridia bacterium]|nr:SpoIIE family protein phosphatase [Clostridia bacterium]